MAAYYNEIDPYAAQWLRNLIAAGHLPAGDVDQRDIRKVMADDIKGYAQCHFFAGIGGWAYALRLAGWADDRPVWTGSCPCQPFSAAGKRSGQQDERHLWPHWFRLIRQCRPARVFGEQVAAAVAQGWLDDMACDLEAENYAVGASVLPACAAGAFHRRDRLWFVADAGGAEWRAPTEGRGDVINGYDTRRAETPGGFEFHGESRDMANPQSIVRRPELCHGESTRNRQRQLADAGGENSVMENTESFGWGERGAKSTWQQGRFSITGASASCGAMGDTKCERPQGHGGGQPCLSISEGRQDEIRPAGYADGISWIDCPDGKARPVKSGIRLLAHGIPCRVGRLRAYGNAIVPQVAAEFIIAAEGWLA